MARLRVGACLSLSGRYAPFGRQAAGGLDAWRSLDGAADLVIEDDHSDPHVLEPALREVAKHSDVLLGPYSTQLMRTAGSIAAQAGWLVWNHGGSGDDVEAAHPGHVVSVLTPAGRYAEPFIGLLAGQRFLDGIVIASGRGSFGRQVADGAETTARQRAIPVTRAGQGQELPADMSGLALLSAGTFEADVGIVRRALACPRPPARVCAVAAGVRAFGASVSNAEGIYGIAQWFPGSSQQALLGPAEADFLAACTARTGTVPDYPAAQAAAAAAIAAACARQAGGTTRELLWSAAAALDTATLFGGFRIDPDTGTQLSHRTVLLQWTAQGLRPVPRLDQFPGHPG